MGDYDEDSQSQHQGIQKLPQDFGSPAEGPPDEEVAIDSTHPQTDTNIDSHELYDEGLSGTIEVTDRVEPTVLSYDPTKISDKK